MSELSKMEKIKMLKDKIVLAFANFDNPEGTPETVKAEGETVEGYEGTLKTGEAVRIMPSLENGAVLTVVSPEGELPAPDGSYELSDGTTLDVVSGVVANIQTPAPTPQETAMAAEIETLKEANTKLSATIESLKTDFEAKFSAIETKLTAQNELTKVLNEGLVELMETPTVAPTEAPKSTDVKFTATTSAEEWRKQNQERIKQAKINLKK